MRASYKIHNIQKLMTEKQKQTCRNVPTTSRTDLVKLVLRRSRRGKGTSISLSIVTSTFEFGVL